MQNQQISKVDRGLIRAHLLNGLPRNSGSTPISKSLTWEEVTGWTSEQGPIWIHLDRTQDYVEKWLNEDQNITPEVIDSLLRNDTRPRFSEMANDQVIIIVKGINLNKNDSPEDMVSLRIWTDGVRLISLGFKPVVAIDTVGRLCELGKGPTTIEDLLLNIIRCLDSKIEPLVYQLSNLLDEYEDTVESNQNVEEDILHRLQVQSTILKRSLMPQRDVLNRMRQTNTSWLKRLKGNWRELYYALAVYVDELSETNDRIAMHQEVKNQKLLHQSNQTMYILSIVAAIFLPLGFLTGLLGINVGGIPGSDNPYAFYIFIAVLLLVVGVQIWLFKLKKWL